MARPTTWEGRRRRAARTGRHGRPAGATGSIVVLNWRDTWHPEGGGSEVYVREVARRLHADGHRVTVFSAHYPGAPEAEVRDGIRYVRRGDHFTVYLWSALFLVLGRLGPFGRFDRVLEVQNGVPFLARLFTRAHVCVLVHHVHREQWSILGPVLSRVGWFLESRLAVWVNRGLPYVAVSEVTRSELVTLGVRPLDITIAWNGLPSVPDFVDLGPAQRPHLVMVSRLVPHKRVEHAIDAVAALRGRHPGLRLTVVSSGWWQDKLLEHRAERGVEDAVTFAGAVGDPEKFEILSTGWVHLMPSVKEGWGLAVIEAAHVGVPSVAYHNAGGVSESILDGVTGLLAADEADFVAQVDRLLSDARLRRDLGDKARIRSGQFSWDTTAATVAAALVPRR